MSRAAQNPQRGFSFEPGKTLKQAQIVQRMTSHKKKHELNCDWNVPFHCSTGGWPLLYCSWITSPVITHNDSVVLCCVQEVKVAASDTTSSGSLPLSLKVWQEERAAKTGRGVSDTLADPCCASYRCYCTSTNVLRHCTTTAVLL